MVDTVLATDPEGRVSIKVGFNITEIQSPLVSYRAYRPGIPLRNLTMERNQNIPLYQKAKLPRCGAYTLSLQACF
jgi:hypothetical protein